MRIGRHPRLVVALLSCLLSLPFLQQAYHIDDRIYLETAQNILQKPLFPYDYPVLFEGLISPDAASHSHLPLTSYLLAAVRWLSGGQDVEWASHLAFLALTLLALWAFYDLAGQLVRFPLAAAALLAISPGFLVLSHTLMADIPFLAFWLLALSRFLPICRNQAGRCDWILCAAGLAAAALTSLLTLGLLLLMAALWLLHNRLPSGGGQRVSGRLVVALLLLPLLIWLIWYGRGYLHYDRFLLVNTFQHMGKRDTLEASLLGLKLGSFVLNLGATLLFPAALWYGLARSWSGRIFALLFFVALIPFALGAEDWSWMQAVLFAAFLATGSLAVFAVLRSAVEGIGGRSRESGVGGRESGVGSRGSGVGNRESGVGNRESGSGQQPPAHSLFIPLWFLGILAACLLLFYAGSVRYTILAAPPLILIWIRELENKVRGNPYLLRNLVWLGFFLTLPYSLWIAQADNRFAGMYRQAARQMVELYRSEGRTVWFTAEWGLRYYLERHGAKPLARVSAQPEAGDIILKPYVAFPWVTLYDSPPYSLYLRRHRLDMPGRLRLLDFSSRAGFYSTGWGILPWGLNEGKEWEWINVYQVKKKYDGPIPEQEQHW